MRVLVGTHYFAPHTGGIETVARQHATRLADRGHDVTVVSSGARDAPDRERRDGYRVHRYRAFDPFERFGVPYPLPDPLSVRSAVADARADAPLDVVHVHGLNYPSTAMVATTTPDDVPTVLQQHTPFVEYGQPWRLVERANDALLGRFNLRGADVVICVSDDIREYVRSLASGTDPAVLHNGVDVDRFTPHRAPTANEEWPDEETVFLTFARPSAKKGTGVLLDAAERLGRAGVDARFVVAGPGSSADHLHRRIEGLDTVTRAGYVPDPELPAYYAAADGYVFPSRSGEAFPTMTVLEALASGTPVVAARVDSRMAGLDDGRNGLVVPPGDPEALAGALSTLAEQPERTASMAAAARATAVRKFDIEDRVDRLEAIYESVVDAGAVTS